MPNKHVIYNEDLQTAICIACQRGLPDNVPVHFMRNHKEIDLSERKEIAKYVNDLIRRPVKEVLFSISKEEVDPIDGIEILDGFKCIADETCQEVDGTPESMRKHCNQAHGWDATQRKILVLINN